MLSLVAQDSEFLVENGSSVLIINRPNGEIYRVGSEKAEAAHRPGATTTPIVGVLGLIEVSTYKFLAVATSGRQKGSIGDAPVFQVTGTKVFKLASVSDATNDDNEYESLIQAHLNNATLFYSPTYDLTSSSQRSALLVKARKPTLDDRFVWNWEASQALAPFPEYVFPVIYGVFSAASLVVNGQRVDFCVISRRSRFRAGTRYFRRGIDRDGHVANFNETEQLLRVGPRLFSYLQTRGSVPAFWSEINNLKYKPKLRTGDLADSVDAAKLHFADQEARYGHQYLVNLVNQSGYEQPVKQIYEDVVSHLHDPKITYIYFDFHHECSKMRWHRVKLLLDELRAKGLDESGYFEILKSGEIVKEQTGIVRTNCMDCLDRTNVVQSTLALYQLEKQLEDAGVLANGASITTDPKFVSVFRNTWADNADGVSCAYSGTGALKTDFTRTGKRTKAGALQDLRNSIVRYYRNNLRDGPRQDGYSAFLGDLKQPHAGAMPFVDRRPVGVQAMPYVAGGCALVAVLSILYPSEVHSTLFNTVVTLTFAAIAALALKTVFKNGLQYVNWPKLTPVRFVRWSPSDGYQIDGEHHGSKEE